MVCGIWEPDAVDTSKLTALVAAAESGSLSRAAIRLGAQLSTVSRQIADLESTLGAPLLVRTGRGVRPTAEGERFVERARVILRELDMASAEVRGAANPHLSLLRLSAPPDLSQHLLPAVLVELAARHPALGIEARTDVRRVSLLEEEYDAAIRLGTPRESDLVARVLGTVSLLVCASDEVAATLRTVRDLERAEHVTVASVPAELVGTLRGRPVRLRHAGRMSVASFLEAAEVAARSNRVAVLPSFTAAPHLRAGRLVHVIRGLTLPKITVHLLHPQRHRGSPVLRDLGDLVAKALAETERFVLPVRTRAREH
jgi:DNA-binding transcriptional LysR family regulator